MNAKPMRMTARMNIPDAGFQFPRSSQHWREYFRNNAASLLHIPWESGVSLTNDERKSIAVSVQQFQLGESSDGHHFLYAAREHALAGGDAQYVPALRRLIAEEQRHGRDLGRVLDLAGIERIHHAWADTIFRWLRRQAGLELSISILVTAEIIAQVYYLALRDATGSLVIGRLCDQILRDEDEHVRFQCERLAILRRGQRPWRVILKHASQRCFFYGTCLVFWMTHAPVMRAGGFGFIAFLRTARRKLRIAMRMMDPRRYRFPEAPSGSKEEPRNPITPTADPLDLSGKWLDL